MRIAKWTLIVALATMACGDGGGPTGGTSTTSAPPASVTNVIGEGSGSLQSNSFGIISGQTSVRGDLELIVDWTFSDSTLSMYVTNGQCTAEQFQQDVCPFDSSCPCSFIVRSESSEPKPRRLRVSGHQGPFGLIVWNVSMRDESISWQALLTTTATTLRPTGSGQGLMEAPVAASKPFSP